MVNHKKNKSKLNNKSSKKQTYKYNKDNSILVGDDEFKLSIYEYYIIYNFFVTFSMCANQSFKKRNFKDYGNDKDTIVNSNVEKNLLNKFDIHNKNFIFTEKDDLKEQFDKLDLKDGEIVNLEYERFVIGKTNDSNKYLKLFYRLRDGFAHGKFRLKFNNDKAKMIIVQDDDTHNVTARIILKLDTIINIIKCIDINNIIFNDCLSYEIRNVDMIVNAGIATLDKALELAGISKSDYESVLAK